MYKAQADAQQGGAAPGADAANNAGAGSAQGDTVEDVDFEEVK
jgi:molecular chaperone DnaK